MGIAKDNAAYRYAEMPEVDGALIVESGGNSDGTWIKWADGTMVCYGETEQSSGSVSNGEGVALDFTFPIAFNEAPTVFSAMGPTGYGNAGAQYPRSISETGGLWSVYNAHASTWNSVAGKYLANGKWK